jgi:uncharacterized protein Yka (UPF0111/DUF47 family)
MWFSWIMSKLMPKKDIFFALFQKQCAAIEASVALFAEMSQDFNGLEGYAIKAKDLERQGDTATLDIIKALNDSFITPFDREDIHPLAHDLDDVTDRIEQTVKELFIYGVTDKPQVLDLFLPLMQQAVAHLNRAILLFELKKYSPEFAAAIFGIREIEHEADGLYARKVRELFATETDALTIFKLNRVIANLENIIDAFQTVANRVEGIVVKWS